MTIKTLIAAVWLGAVSAVLAASTVNLTNRYAYAANTGWTDARADTLNGAVIGRYVCSNYLYAANTGWIHLGDGTPSNGVAYGNAYRSPGLQKYEPGQWQALMDNIAKGDYTTFNQPVFPKGEQRGVGFHEAPRLNDRILPHCLPGQRHFLIVGGNVFNQQMDQIDDGAQFPAAEHR